MRRWANVGLLLGQHRRRLANSKPTVARSLMFAGLSVRAVKAISEFGEIEIEKRVIRCNYMFHRQKYCVVFKSTEVNKCHWCEVKV